MFEEFKSSMGRNITNSKGWRTNRKVIVIESDDWGGIRMPNKKIYKGFKDLGFDVDSCPYCRYDTLANTQDLNGLFEVLKSFRDKNDRHPIFTFNTVMANPLFEKIEESGFAEYSYESFPDTLARYYPNEKVFQLWRQGIDENLIRPQFHGREHVNVLAWLDLLRQGNKALLTAFSMGFWGIPKSFYGINKINIQAAFGSSGLHELEFSAKNIREGLQLFEEIFGFKSKTFIANNYTFPDALNSVLFNAGVNGIQGMKKLKIPQKNGEIVTKNNFTGRKNSFHQVYTVRNVMFEPSQMPRTKDNVGDCLNEIRNSFFWRKPAIISSHRLNYIGSINEENRKQNLEMLSELFEQILKNWPDVEFLSSDELVDIIGK